MKSALVAMMLALVWTHPVDGDERRVAPLQTFSCDIAALSEADIALYQKLTHSLVDAVQETVELEDGYAFRLSPETLVTTARWVSLERKCCPFFAFEIEVASSAGPSWLRITGAEGVKEFIRTEFANVISDGKKR